MHSEQLSAQKSFGGIQLRLRHRSVVLGCEMVFAVYLPPQFAAGEKLPVLYWLSGLTCTDENFMHKSGVQRIAAELGIIIVAPDTSPRGEDIPGDPDGAWDFGLGAGFYVDATQPPWSAHYRMHDYVVNELPGLIDDRFANSGRKGISGHSMGGHGAMVCALRNPGRYQSVSAFAPICHPAASPWGQKAFGHLLGADQSTWQQWDASQLIAQAQEHLPLLIDQGDADNFLDTQLNPESLRIAAATANYPMTLRLQSGYDHSYFFIASFIEDHLRHHAFALTDA